MSRVRVVAIVIFIAIAGRLAVHGDDQLIEVGDAYVRTVDGGWTIGNGLVEYGIGSVPGGVGIRAIEDRVGGRNWLRGEAPDSTVGVDSVRVSVGGSSTVFERAEVTEWWGGVKLALRYRLSSPALTIVRSYAVYPSSSVVESWTTFESRASRSVALSDLTAYALSVQTGTLGWINGLQSTTDDGSPFTRLSGDLDDGQVFTLGSNGRSSEQTLPWFTIEADGDQLFGSFLWSGSWRFRVERRGDAARIELGLPPFTTQLPPGGSLETPHGIVGLTNRVVPTPSLALRSFLDQGVRHGRSFWNRVSYNTWYSFGTFIDEASLMAEMNMAAALGVEQFVVDAGWWFHINPDDASDYIREWGNWEVDPERFPNGLGALSDYAHALGMKFGAWVEPERVDRVTVGRPGLARERFLATMNGGQYDPGAPNSRSVSAQVCLVDQEARSWVVDRLVSFIESSRLDYLKWDNNFWLNCTRTGHGHGDGDGNYLHHRALGGVLDLLRERFPELEIENCASGGNRLSLEMLAHTDTAWVDDRTGPAHRVRHNAQGLLTLFPAPYLLSFTTVPIEAINESLSADVPYVVRSRMLGASGLSMVLSGTDEGTRAELSKQIDLAKRIRPILEQGAGFLLSPQVSNGEVWSGWDVVQYVSPLTGDAALFAYASPDAPTDVIVRPKGLAEWRSYVVESADLGELGTAMGRDLMEQGVQLRTSAVSLAHVLVLRAQN